MAKNKSVKPTKQQQKLENAVEDRKYIGAIAVAAIVLLLLMAWILR